MERPNLVLSILKYNKDGEKMLLELLIILSINYLGIILAKFLMIPLPGLIVGMAILLFLLETKILKLKYIEKTADAMLLNMTILFLPATVKLIDYIDVLKSNIFKIIMVIILATIISIVVTAKVVHHMIMWKEKKNGRNIE
ncbi:MAG: CidA/LrgA family protein [Fusobacteriaceae bacterium]